MADSATDTQRLTEAEEIEITPNPGSINLVQLEKYILAKIHMGTDFPVTSAAVTGIGKLTTTEDASITELTNIILKDYGLTSKILKIVNTVNFVQFGSVTTVSRALFLLGMDNVKNLVISMSLFDQINRSGTGLSSLLIKAVYAGVLGRRIAERMDHVNAEEVFICSLFHFLGEILTAYYVPAKYKEIKKTMDTSTDREREAGHRIFQSLFEKIGEKIGTDWGFPDKVIKCMKKLEESELNGRSETDLLHSICALANRLAEINSLSGGNKGDLARTAVRMFGNRFGRLNKDIDGLINIPREDFETYCAAYGLDFEKALATQETGRIQDEAKPDVSEMLKKMSLDLTLKNPETEMTPEQIFASGLHDITSTMIDKGFHNINDVIRMVMETMFRGLSHARVGKVAFFMRNPKEPSLEIRSIIGDSLITTKKWIHIPLGETLVDVFNLALREQKNLVIDDTRHYSISHILPSCFKENIKGDMFMILLPVVINGISVGVFHIVGPAQEFTKITPGQLHQLKILMGQAILAIREKVRTGVPA